MEAHLDGSGFRIRPITEQRQVVTGEGTTWKWEVEPLKSSTYPLHLTLYALLRVGETTVYYGVMTSSHTAMVEITFSDRLWAFVANNWQWLWVTILVPFGTWCVTWLWGFYTQRRAATEPTRRD